MKSPSLHPETGRMFGIDMQPADEIHIAYGAWRDEVGGRLKPHVILRLCNSKTETGHNMSMSRVRARQIAKALYEASGMRWPTDHKPRAVPNRILLETRAIMNRQAGFAIIMENLLLRAVEFLDQELEDRKFGGNDEEFADLQTWSDEAHSVLRTIGGEA